METDHLESPERFQPERFQRLPRGTSSLLANISDSCLDIDVLQVVLGYRPVSCKPQ